ncbi:Hypothetical protein FKW44_023507, partial [Caligus rogercresseyi]
LGRNDERNQSRTQQGDILATQHTANALQELANYFLTEKGFQYVLLGKINSNPLDE